MLAIYFIWGSTYIAIRFGIQTIPPFLLAGIRFLTAGTLLFVWRMIAGDRKPSRNQWLSAAKIGILMLVFGNGLVTWSELHIDSGITALLGGTVPIWMVICDWLFSSRRKPHRLEAVGLIIGFGGVAVLVGPGSLIDGMEHYNFVGSGAVVVASLFWALGSIMSKDADMPESPLLGTSMEMLAGSIGLFTVSIITGEAKGFQLVNVSTNSIFGLAYLIFFGSLGAFVAYTWLLRNAPTPLVATYAYVNPMVAILLGNLLAQEPFSLQLLIAIVMILGSVFLINRGRQMSSSQ